MVVSSVDLVCIYFFSLGSSLLGTIHGFYTIHGTFLMKQDIQSLASFLERSFISSRVSS
jgi:hypothetical protein